MTGPVRVQLSRKKGWRKPPNTVNVARPSKWGNPFVVGQTYPVHEGYIGGPEIGQAFISNRADAVDAFRSWAVDDDTPIADVGSLRGKNLACWCPLFDEDGNRVPCHADVLLELANKEPAA